MIGGVPRKSAPCFRWPSSHVSFLAANTRDCCSTPDKEREEGITDSAPKELSEREELGGEGNLYRDMRYLEDILIGGF